MRTPEDDDLTDLELNEVLAVWSVPDPPTNLRARVFSELNPELNHFSEQHHMSTEVRNSFLEIPASVEEPWGKSLIGNIKAFVRSPQVSPFEVTSRPVEVQGIWGAYSGRQSRSLATALLIQSAAIALLCLAVPSPLPLKVRKSTEAIALAFYHPKVAAKQKPSGGGGGGQRSLTAVANGAAPKYAVHQFDPPAVAVPLPRLPVIPTISAPVPQIDASTYGDPLSTLTDGSAGQGINGLGNGTGGGLGNGEGEGYGSGEGGGAGGGAFRIGGDVSSPVLLSKVEPEYSEEARKAKFSGMVVLSVVVDEHGVPRNIRVVRPLGLGLDQKAIDAVTRWRFRPGVRHGKAVSVIANVEVSFRLL